MTRDDLRLDPGARVLVVDRHEQNLLQVRADLEAVGHIVLLARHGEEALRRVRCDDPELVLLDASMLRPNAYQLCERIKTHPATRNLPVILLVAPHAMEEKIRGLEVGADDFLHRPINKIELLSRVKSLVRVKRLNNLVENTESVIFDLARMVEQKEAASPDHLDRLIYFATLLGRAAGLSPEELDVLRKSALLHDIGKVAVREQVLLKNGRLTEAEFNELRIHPEVGERICAPLRAAEQVMPVIRHHRERWDGRGYPDGLAGEAIPLLARILAIADAYDAMLSHRPYRPALSPTEAREVLRRGAGSQWDPRLVQLFLDALDAEALHAA